MNEETVSLREHFEKILEEKDRANNQRFNAQEKAIETAEHNRDIAINKAEASIEKKSDIAYVKISDLQKALSEVMLRPEIESRLKELGNRTDDLKTSRDTSQGKGLGAHQLYGYLAGLIGVGIAIASFLSQ